MKVPPLLEGLGPSRLTSPYKISASQLVIAGPGKGCNKFDSRRAEIQCCKERTNNIATFESCKAAPKGRG